ncbi:Uncharacterised protein [Vibrio cholerae]|nr:Uncharacterised protein [Vibrio cholerae]CSD24897.1 Uncharacterised protein [Vibrio cholerae]
MATFGLLNLAIMAEIGDLTSKFDAALDKAFHQKTVSQTNIRL